MEDSDIIHTWFFFQDQLCLHIANNSLVHWDNIDKKELFTNERDEKHRQNHGYHFKQTQVRGEEERLMSFQEPGINTSAISPPVNMYHDRKGLSQL